MDKTMQKSRRYSGACDFGFAIADCFPTSVTLSGGGRAKSRPVKVLYPYFIKGFQFTTRREGEMETRGNSRISISTLHPVTLSGVEVCYCEVKGSGNDPATVRQIAETGRIANHFQVSGSDRRSFSTLSFELFTLSLSYFRMHGKTNSIERIPVKQVFTN